MQYEQDRVWLEAKYLKEMLDQVRQYWIDLENNLTPEEQLGIWGYLNSMERTFLKNRVNATTKSAEKEL